MNKLKIILLAIIITGCECVPGLDAPKEITPGNSTDCLFINGIEDNQEIFLETDEIKIPGSISYKNTSYDFKKVKIGSYYLKIKALDSTSVIYNSPIKFQKDKKYILAAAGANYFIQTHIIEFDSFNQDFTELINLSGNISPLEISIISGADTISHNLNQLSSVKLNLFNQKIDLLYIKNQNFELEFSQKDIILLKNNLLIIKGNHLKNKSGIILDIVVN